MTTISIRLPDELFQEVERCARELHLPRTEYIRRAIQAMNQTMLQDSRRQRMFEASRKVRENSMRVNAEFAAIEDEPDV